MRFLPFYLSLLFLSFSCQSPKVVATSPTASAPTKIDFSAQKKTVSGFFDFWWDEKVGKIYLKIDKLDTEFLYVNSLAAGVGSNDIGLDRGQLGRERVVKFVRVGPKILLVQPNYRFRAESNNPEERKSVEEAFAQSVLWGFKVQAEEDGIPIVDATAFLLRDAHNVVGTLQETKQGNYKLDFSRSAIYLDRTRNFPRNTEFEATLTFVGKPQGGYIRQVAPSATAITVRQHHSLIQLPDDNYKPRAFDPRSGYFEVSYQDYATPIDQPLVKRWITRHRLAKKDPTAALSEAVEPIVYYLDRGAPEPVRSALLEGASWWNQAFTAAGYKDAFRVELLPEDADPMDVRYNVIQWVHRATRGWSYGSSVIDPRTGEIIKGHVSLGSLRVRQDFMIAQGLFAAYENGEEVSPRLLEMALARLRQLSAHEVGHTIGLAHNFAASTNNRASVMDYPHPFVQLKSDGSLDFSQAYDDKIGAWDKRSVLYGYQDFPAGTDEAAALRAIIQASQDQGLRFISDQDARPAGGAHPYAHLWDNGSDAVTELERLSELRKVALQRFGLSNIPKHMPLSELETVLVPLYLSHRYQMEAVAKLIGGINYEYTVNNEKPAPVEVVAAAEQAKALQAILQTLKPDFLVLPEDLLRLIPPQPLGYGRGRENFKGLTGPTFDPLAAAESSINTTLGFILHPHRINRLLEQEMLNKGGLTIQVVCDALIELGWTAADNNYPAQLERLTDLIILEHLMQLANDKAVHAPARSVVLQVLADFKTSLEQRRATTPSQRAHLSMAKIQLDRFAKNPAEWKPSRSLKMPAGSPIGCGGAH